MNCVNIGMHGAAIKKNSNINFHENLFIGDELVNEDIEKETDGWIDIKKSIIASRITANTPIDK